jgi:hypothetical protein
MSKLNSPIPARAPAAKNRGAAGMGNPNWARKDQRKSSQYPWRRINWIILFIAKMVSEREKTQSAY